MGSGFGKKGVVLYLLFKFNEQRGISKQINFKKTVIMKVDEQLIKQIKNPELSIEFWEIQLGVAVSEDAGHTRSASEWKINGIKYWNQFKSSIQELICDQENRKPNFWMEELMSGDIREVIIAIVTALTTQLSIALSMAIPLTALILKYGVNNFCSIEFK